MTTKKVQKLENGTDSATFEYNILMELGLKN